MIRSITNTGPERGKGDAIVSEIESRGYSHPDALVSTEWVAQHLNDPGFRLAESNEDPLL